MSNEALSQVFQVRVFRVSAVQHVKGKRDVVGFSGNRFCWRGSVNIQGGKKGGGMLPGIIVPICLFWWGQATLSELSAHFEPPARLPWNIAAARPVCVYDQNKYELHTNKSRQLPCYSTEVVYWENLLVTWYQLIQVFVNGAEQDWWTRWLSDSTKTLSCLFVHVLIISYMISCAVLCKTHSQCSLLQQSVPMTSQGLMFCWRTSLFVSMCGKKWRKKFWNALCGKRENRKSSGYCFTLLAYFVQIYCHAHYSKRHLY